ncbi:hypothetical protein Droror1_Dr00011280 [Drosera rotundifolia]
MVAMFFADSGFPCPSFRNPSDHFLRTINNDFELNNQDDIDQGRTAARSRADDNINLLIKAYQFSGNYQQVQNQVRLINKEEGAILKKGNQSSSLTQCIVFTKRSSVNMYRDVGYYWLRLGIYIAIYMRVHWNYFLPCR